MAATQLLPWHSEMDFLAHDDGILALAALAQRVEDLEPAGSNKQIVAASMRAPRLSRHLARLGRHDQRCRRSHGGLERQQDRGNLSLLGCINAISTIDVIAAHDVRHRARHQDVARDEVREEARVLEEVKRQDVARDGPSPIDAKM